MSKHGGKRPNAGRPQGGRYGEKTVPVRVPASRVTEIKSLITGPGKRIPLYSTRVEAGFPSPGDDHIEAHLDLNEYLVPHPAATFMVRATGESMLGAGIHPGDILIVDRSLKPVDNKIVIAALAGELTVKRLSYQGKRIQLLPENDAYEPIDVTDNDTVIWGVVTHVIHGCG